MKNWNYSSWLLLFVLLFAAHHQFLFAQDNSKGVKVEGESIIRVETNKSIDDTKKMAFEAAMINAIENSFGKYIRADGNLTINDNKMNFSYVGETKVRGEWVKTIAAEYTPKIRQNKDGWPETWITCKVKGIARKINSKPSLLVKVLSNSDKNSTQSHFNSGARMYIYVKSPVDGYLSLFIDDGNEVYCMLPYREMENKSTCRINADTEYILFAENFDYFDGSVVDPLFLKTEKELEKNKLTVVFSTKEYYKPLLNDEKVYSQTFNIPRSLSKAAFQNWLANNKATSPDFVNFDKEYFIRGL